MKKKRANQKEIFRELTKYIMNGKIYVNSRILFRMFILQKIINPIKQGIFFSVRFSDDIELMTGRRPHHYWLFCWRYVAPATMITILSCSFVKIATEGVGYEAWDKETVSFRT